MTMFSWLLKRFIAAFIILVVVQFVLYFTGLSLILSGYEKNQLARYESAAEKILRSPEDAVNIELPSDNPFFVFNAEKELIYSNKGKGRSLSVDEFQPVSFGSTIVGYYHAGETHFADNQANRIFLISIIVLSTFSIVLSVIIGFISAFLSSKKIVEPVGQLREDIHDLRLFQTLPVRSFRIRELSEMSTDLSGVSQTLSSQEEYKRQWLRDLAHDLRTPLSGLKSQLEAMADGVLEPSPDRFRRHLLEIDRLENLASSIGELMAIESRKEVEISEISIKHFVEYLVRPFEFELQQKAVRLEIETEDGSLYGDEQLLLRAFGNIMANAVKYVEENGLIRISITSEGAGVQGAGVQGQTRIEIVNNGPDIPFEQHDLIFTRLYRGESARTTPGSGLGLSITREIIKLHGGVINVEQFDPRGVCFRVKLPVK